MFKCNDCGAEFHETDMNRHQQKNEICPFCGGEDLYVKTQFQINDKTYEGELRLIKNKDKSETLICETSVNNKPLTLEVKIKKEKPDLWGLSCGGWQMSSTYEERFDNVAYLIRTNIEVIESFIEADKYKQVRISIPKGEDCDGCPMFNDYEDRCQYLDVKTQGKKDVDCPATKYENC